MNSGINLSVSVGSNLLGEDILYPSTRWSSQYSSLRAVPLKAGVLDQIRRANTMDATLSDAGSVFAECEAIAKRVAKISIAEERILIESSQ